MSRLVVGAGRVTWDVVFREGQLLGGQAGGTCGNVLAILAWLGWRALPAASMDGGEEACVLLICDLLRFGVDCEEMDGGGESVPVVCHDISSAGHSFRAACPSCGRSFDDVEDVGLNLAQQAFPRIGGCSAFFFDQDAPSTLWLALRLREQGALVVLEPSYAGPEVDFDACLKVAHVLKYSRSQLPGLHERVNIGPRLVIETEGANGLRYRLDGVWHDSAAFPASGVRDTAGAGDWTTAGFIAHFAGWDTVGDALRRGQAMAAWSVAFDGARGGMYAATREEFDRETAAILAGEVFDPGAGKTVKLPDAGRFCVCRASGTA